jgi:hypothetical protein
MIMLLRPSPSRVEVNGSAWLIRIRPLAPKFVRERAKWLSSLWQRCRGYAW